MAFQPGLLDTGIAGRTLASSKVDLATPVNMFTSLQANKRANQTAADNRRLTELTLNETERKQKRQQQIQDILKSSLNEKGLIDSKRAVVGLNQAGYFDEANTIQQREAKAFETKQKMAVARDQVLGQSASAILDSENPVETFMIAREELAKKGVPMSQVLLNYMPTDEEIQDGRLDPKVNTELDYLKNRVVSEKSPMSLEDKLLLMRERYQEKRNLAKTKSDIKVDQPLTESEKSREKIAKTKVGIAKKKLDLEKEKSERDAELFEQKKIDLARKNRAYIQKNKSQLNSIQEFLDKAYSVSGNPNMKKISGGGRYWIGGSKVPIFETEGKDLQADIDFLTDMGVIETMTKLKAESPTGSTGFGALSEKELMVMKNAFSLLGNPDISGAKKKIEVDRVIEIMERRAREQREYDRQSDNLLGPEKTEDELILDGIDEL